MRLCDLGGANRTLESIKDAIKTLPVIPEGCVLRYLDSSGQAIIKQPEDLRLDDEHLDFVAQFVLDNTETDQAEVSYLAGLFSQLDSRQDFNIAHIWEDAAAETLEVISAEEAKEVPAAT